MKFQITDDPNYVNREEICKQRMAEKRIELEPKIINAVLNCIQNQIDNKHYKVEKLIFEQTVTISVRWMDCISYSELDAMGFNAYSSSAEEEYDAYLRGILTKVVTKINAKYPSWKISFFIDRIFIRCKRKEFEF